MVEVFFSLCLLTALTGTCLSEFTATQDGITIECKDSLMALPEEPKQSFSVKCTTTGNINDVVVGKWLTYKKIDQETGIGKEEDRRMADDNKPYIVYNSTHLADQLLETAAPGRYSVEKDASMVEVTITDAETPDSGLWFCGSTETTYDDFIIETSPYCNIYVVGLPEISIFDPNTGDIFGDNITLGPENITVPFGVKIEKRNVEEDEWEILIAGKDVRNSLSRSYPSTFTGSFDGGYNSYYYSERYLGTFTVDDETRNTGVEVNVVMSPIGGTTTKTLRIYSNDKPYSVNCGSLEKGKNKATITCEGFMNPIGNVTWHTPAGNDLTVSDGIVMKGNHTVENTISGFQVTSTLTIDADEEANFYGTYNATFKNDYGQVSVGYVEEQPISHGDVAVVALPLLVVMVLSTIIV